MGNDWGRCMKKPVCIMWLSIWHDLFLTRKVKGACVGFQSLKTHLLETVFTVSQLAGGSHLGSGKSSCS